MAYSIMRRISRVTLIVILFLCLFSDLSPSPAAVGNDNAASAVKEGWGWPVVVIPPAAGWESDEGLAVKLGMRLAERQISQTRSGIRGREVIFMFANVTSGEIKERMRVWRNMKVSVIVSFAGPETNAVLKDLCAINGPSLILSGGEDESIINPGSGMPYAYLFALDLPYYARANALSAFALQSGSKVVAIFSDALSPRIAKGARVSSELLKAAGAEPFPVWVSAGRRDRFERQVGEAERGGAGAIISWLEGMGTLSIWRTAALNGAGTKLFHAGNAQRILLDAEGLTFVDKDAPLVQNEEGKHDIILKIRDQFDRVTKDPVTSAKAFAVALWAINAYSDNEDTSPAAIARVLEITRDIPLMSETIYIDRRTHRPYARQYGAYRVTQGEYRYVGSVEVLSSKTTE